MGAAVPSIINYSMVLETLERSGLRCVYPNSGAFGIPPGTPNHILGWAARDDSTIRPEVRSSLRIIPDPAGPTLAALLTRAWHQHFPGPLWLMAASHWAYELQFGGADWLPSLLGKHGVQSEMLRTRTDGSAIEFQPHEGDSLTAIVEELFDRLVASDFTIAFPGRTVVALLHHHQQIWWQTSNQAIWESLDTVI
jgi:hypothetical protein